MLATQGALDATMALLNLLLTELFGSFADFTSAWKSLFNNCTTDGGTMCYGVGGWHTCCSTCDDVQSAFRAAGWDGWERTPLCATEQEPEFDPAETCKRSGCPTCDVEEFDAWLGRLEPFLAFEKAASLAEFGIKTCNLREVQKHLKLLLLQASRLRLRVCCSFKLCLF
jgi:hypothetical protein